MQICIHRHVLGTRQNLLYDIKEKSFCWTLAQPTGIWTFGDPDPRVYDLGAVAALMGNKINSIGTESQVYAYRQLGCNAPIPWQKVLPDKEFHRRLVELISSLEGTLDALHVSGYGNTFLAGRKVMIGLSRAVIDKHEYNTRLASESNATLRKMLKSFEPDATDRAGVVGYSQVDTVTGRLIVKSGPQILTLPKKYRSILRSRYSGGSLLYIDFVSLEPRTCLFAAGKRSQCDIYLDISSDVFDGKLDRDIVKTAVLCALFGAGASRLSKMLPDGLTFSSTQIIKKIRAYFGTDKIMSDLRQQSADFGHIKNMFGRNITLRDKNNMLNYFLQSSAVDIAMLGFSQIIDKAQELGAVPIYVIHDALLLDCPQESAQLIAEKISEPVDISGVGKFPVSIEVITQKSE